MNTKSSHILTTSSNLLGFSFIVLTSIKSFGFPASSLIDELVAVLIVIFASSAIFSFVSIRSKKETESELWETIADYIFLLGLVILTGLSVLISLDVILFTK